MVALLETKRRAEEALNMRIEEMLPAIRSLVNRAIQDACKRALTQTKYMFALGAPDDGDLVSFHVFKRLAEELMDAGYKAQTAVRDKQRVMWIEWATDDTYNQFDGQ